MTKKRFMKLTRAYFTRLNEWAKENGSKPMNMGKVYKSLRNLNPGNITREEWWNLLSKGNTFGVGERRK